MCASNKDLSNDKQKAAGPADAAIPRQIPRGLEVLVKKAAVDPKFKKLLFEKRAEAAQAIGLKLTDAEEAMLAAVPLPQLEGIIAHTRVAPKLRPAFLGYAAGAMLAAVGVGTLDCALGHYAPQRRNNQKETILNDFKAHVVRYRTGSRPSNSRSGVVTGIRTDTNDLFGNTDLDDDIRRLGGYRGIRPDRPLPKTAGRPTIETERISVRLATPGPSSIGGSGAGHPNRSPRIINSVIRRHLAGIAYAYKWVKRKNPGLRNGKITVALTIMPDGAVKHARVVSDTIGDAAFRRSLLARIRSWRFPPIEEGDVTVIYPFVFVPEVG